jgi:hypothetical protein
LLVWLGLVIHYFLNTTLRRRRNQRIISINRVRVAKLHHLLIKSNGLAFKLSARSLMKALFFHAETHGVFFVLRGYDVANTQSLLMMYLALLNVFILLVCWDCRLFKIIVKHFVAFVNNSFRYRYHLLFWLFCWHLYFCRVVIIDVAIGHYLVLV